MKKKYRAVLFCFAVLSLPWQLFARRGAPEGPAKPKETLAVVAIPAYIDTTGSQNYGYLSGSLTDAVDASMQQKFDYSRAKQNTVEAETKRLWQPKKIPSDQEIRQIATATQSDYVVVGSYSLSPNKKQIIFYTRIFIAPDKFIDTPPLTNNADATLFDATNKVATEIVQAIETEALARATAANQAKAKGGEKITLAKVVEPTASTTEENYSRHRSRYFGIGLGYGTNTIERHTQFYQYASASTMINADLRISDNFMIYGKFALPQTPSGGQIPTNYKNNGNQTVGFEVGDRVGDYVFGMNYRNFSDVNPAGIYVRDLLGWSASAYVKSHFNLFTVAGVYFGLDLDSYADIYSTKVTGITTNGTKALWNVEGAVNVSYFLPVVNASITGIVGGAYSLLDTTGQFLTTTSGVLAWDTANRNGIFTGVRYGLELAKWFNGVELRGEVYATPSVAAKYQPLDEQNARRTSYVFATVSAGYRFGF